MFYRVTLSIVFLSITFFMFGSPTIAQRADFDHNDQVNIVDFLLFADGFRNKDPDYDLDGNGEIDFSDFLQFAQSISSYQTFQSIPSYLIPQGEQFDSQKAHTFLILQSNFDIEKIIKNNIPRLEHHIIQIASLPRFHGVKKLASDNSGFIVQPVFAWVFDFDHDGQIDYKDFLLIAQGYGKRLGDEGYDPRWDTVQSGISENIIDLADVQLFSLYFRSYRNKRNATQGNDFDFLHPIYVWELTQDGPEMTTPYSAFSYWVPNSSNQGTVVETELVGSVPPFASLSDEGVVVSNYGNQDVGSGNILLKWRFHEDDRISTVMAIPYTIANTDNVLTSVPPTTVNLETGEVFNFDVNSSEEGQGVVYTLIGSGTGTIDPATGLLTITGGSSGTTSWQVVADDQNGSAPAHQFNTVVASTGGGDTFTVDLVALAKTFNRDRNKSQDTPASADIYTVTGSDTTLVGSTDPQTGRFTAEVPISVDEVLAGVNQFYRAVVDFGDLVLLGEISQVPQAGSTYQDTIPIIPALGHESDGVMDGVEQDYWQRTAGNSNALHPAALDTMRLIALNMTVADITPLNELQLADLPVSAQGLQNFLTDIDLNGNDRRLYTVVTDTSSSIVRDENGDPIPGYFYIFNSTTVGGATATVDVTTSSEGVVTGIVRVSPGRRSPRAIAVEFASMYFPKEDDTNDAPHSGVFSRLPRGEYIPSSEVFGWSAQDRIMVSSMRYLPQGFPMLQQRMWNPYSAVAGKPVARALQFRSSHLSNSGSSALEQISARYTITRSNGEVIQAGQISDKMLLGIE